MVGVYRIKKFIVNQFQMVFLFIFVCIIVFLIYMSFHLIIIFNGLKYLSKRRIIEQNLLHTQF